VCACAGVWVVCACAVIWVVCACAGIWVVCACAGIWVVCACAGIWKAEGATDVWSLTDEPAWEWREARIIDFQCVMRGDQPHTGKKEAWTDS